MKLKISFSDIDLNIEINGADILDLIDFAMKALFYMREKVLEERLKARKTSPRAYTHDC